MATAISWTNETWNPVTGCSKVSPGCAHCYAEGLSMRFGWSKKPWTPENATENVVLHPERLEKPLHWREPKRVFVNSMSDLFHELVPDEFICQVFTIMRRCPEHIFQVLTKRPERMREFMSKLSWHSPETDAVGLAAYGWQAYLGKETGFVPPNVWLGTSVENQHFADIRIPHLLATPAAVRFLSCEPLLGPVKFNQGVLSGFCDVPCGDYFESGECRCVDRQPYQFGPWPHLDWVIVGGESGPDFRAMNLAWAREIRDQCTEAGVAFFFKQQSARRSETNPHLDGYEYHQFPGNLAEPVAVGV
jgi:protein gp37